MYIARAELGLDPLEGDEPTSTDTTRLLERLEVEGESAGATIRSASVAEVVSQLKEGPTSPTVLAHENGHLYLLLGAIALDGQLMYQLVHGDMPVSLVSKEQLLNAGFQEAWRLSAAHDGVPIHVGPAQLRVSNVYHNFGEVKPSEELNCTFSLSNTGDVPVVVGRATTSCGCLTTTATGNVVLHPHDTRSIDVVVSSGNDVSLQQSVRLPLFEKGNVASEEVLLLIFGCQRQSMRIAPEMLDFGILVPGESCNRTVRMSEVPTDRFLIKTVDSGDLPIDYEIKPTRNGIGLVVYRIHLRFIAPNVLPGKHVGALHVVTDSHIRPSLSIPIQFAIQGRVMAKPSVVAFGTVSIGRTNRQVVELVSRNHESLRVQIASAPAECSVAIEKVEATTRIVVALTPMKAGLWKGVVKATITSVSWSELLEIQCVGYVRTPVHVTHDHGRVHSL